MSLRDLSDALKEERVSFGVREVLKLAKNKKMKKDFRVLVCKDTREETLEKLEKSGVEFEVLKNKKDVSRELGINFDSEVFLIK